MSAPLEIHELIIEARVTSAPPQASSTPAAVPRSTPLPGAVQRDHAALIDTIARLVRQQLRDEKEL